VSQGPGTFQSAAATDLSVHASLLSQVVNDGLVGNLIKLKYIVLITTGWGKIPSLLSVGHCEGRGGRRRVELGSKGAGSWEVPVTTLRKS